jgi:hypothetical protein
LPVNAIVVIGEPEQAVCATGVATALANGLINTVAVVAVPGQPLAVGMMVNVTVIGALVVLIMKPLIVAPEPLAGMPPGAVVAELLSLVHVKVVPATPVNAIGTMVPPEQIVCDVGVAVAVIFGFTKTVAVTGVPGQPFATGVIVKVTVIAAAVVLVNAPLIFPVPLAAMPVTVAVLFLVQL